MRNPVWLAAGALSLLAFGCSGGGAESPLAPAPAGPADAPAPPASTTQAHGSVALGGIVHNGDTAEQALAIYRLDLDPVTLIASITPREVRSAQGNDDVTDLDISCFLGGGELTLDAVAKSAGNIDITYSFAHPFPNTAPHTLGAPVRVVAMFDADPLAPVYFAGDGDIVANTTLMANANGYLDPGQLLDTTGFSATVFPYQVLIEEPLDNRDVSNGGDVVGNWDDVAGEGWQTGLPGTWTGLGWLHKGQTATRTLSLDATALSGGVSFDLAFIAKYTKPNATGANKSPSAPANALEFAYRGFHGALDLESVEYVGESGGFLTNVPSLSTLNFTVRDWDAQATETVELDLQDEADASLVAIGESGEPTLELSIPDVLGATIYTLSEAADSGTGVAGDELVYSETVIKGAGGPIAGDYIGLIRATDAEALSDTSTWHFAIDCATLGLITGPSLSVYQDFTVSLAPDNAAPTATVAVTSADPLTSATMPSLGITSIADPDDDPLDIYIDWGDGLGFPGSPTLSLPGGPVYADQAPVGPPMNNLDLTVDTINVVVRLDDGTATVDYPVSYDLGPNRAPVTNGGAPMFVSTTIGLGGSFSITGTSLAATDPEGDAIDYIATSDVAPLGPFPTATGGPFPVAVGPFPSPATPSITLYASDALHDNLTPALPDSATAYAPVAGTVVNQGWVYTLTTASASSEGLRAAKVAPNGSVFMLFNLPSGLTHNFGGGPRSAIGGSWTRDTFLVKLDAAGQYQWDYHWNDSGYENAFGMDIDAANNVFISGSLSAALNPVVPGPPGMPTITAASGPFAEDGYIMKLDVNGSYVAHIRSNELADLVNDVTWNHNSRLVIDDATGSVYALFNATNAPTWGADLATHPSPGSYRLPYVTRLANTLATVTWNEGMVSANPALGHIGAESLAVDPTGNAYVLLSTSTTGFTIGPVLPSVKATAGSTDLYIVRLAAATGAHTGNRQIGGAGTETGRGLYSDGSRLYLTGAFSGTVANAGPTSMTASGLSDGFIAAYTYAAVPANIWNQRWGGTGTNEFIHGLGVSGANLFAVADMNASSSPTYGVTASGLTSAGGTDAVVIRLVPATGALGVVPNFLRLGTTSTEDFAGGNVQFGPLGDPLVFGNYGAGGALNFNPNGAAVNRTATGTDPFAVMWLAGTFAF